MWNQPFEMKLKSVWESVNHGYEIQDGETLLWFKGAFRDGESATFHV